MSEIELMYNIVPNDIINKIINYEFDHSHISVMGGKGVRLDFNNGYSVSIIWHKDVTFNLYELAIVYNNEFVKFNGDITHRTKSEHKVFDILRDVTSWS